MKYLGKIAGINLFVMLVYTIMIRAASGREKGLGILITSAWVISLHVIINLVIALNFSGNKQGLGKAWLWSTGIVLLVGFSSCLGNASL